MLFVCHSRLQASLGSKHPQQLKAPWQQQPGLRSKPPSGMASTNIPMQPHGSNTKSQGSARKAATQHHASGGTNLAYGLKPLPPFRGGPLGGRVEGGRGVGGRGRGAAPRPARQQQQQQQQQQAHQPRQLVAQGRGGWRQANTRPPFASMPSDGTVLPPLLQPPLPPPPPQQQQQQQQQQQVAAVLEALHDPGHPLHGTIQRMIEQKVRQARGTEEWQEGPGASERGAAPQGGGRGRQTGEPPEFEQGEGKSPADDDDGIADAALDPAIAQLLQRCSSARAPAPLPSELPLACLPRAHTGAPGMRHGLTLLSPAPLGTSQGLIARVRAQKYTAAAAVEAAHEAHGPNDLPFTSMQAPVTLLPSRHATKDFSSEEQQRYCGPEQRQQAQLCTRSSGYHNQEEPQQAGFCARRHQDYKEWQQAYCSRGGSYYGHGRAPSPSRSSRSRSSSPPPYHPHRRPHLSLHPHRDYHGNAYTHGSMRRRSRSCSRGRERSCSREYRRGYGGDAGEGGEGGSKEADVRAVAERMARSVGGDRAKVAGKGEVAE